MLEDKKLSTCENAPMSYHVSKPKKRKMKNWKGIRLGVFLSIFWLFRGVIPPKMCKKGRLVEKLRVQFVQKWGYLSGENLVGDSGFLQKRALDSDKGAAVWKRSLKFLELVKV